MVENLIYRCKLLKKGHWSEVMTSDKMVTSLNCLRLTRKRNRGVIVQPSIPRIALQFMPPPCQGGGVRGFYSWSFIWGLGEAKQIQLNAS